MKPTERTDQASVEVLLSDGYLPSFDLSLKLGRDIQNEWTNSYQEIQITNTFKVLIKHQLAARKGNVGDNGEQV